MKKSAYVNAGVDIDAKMKGLASAKKMIDATATKGVMGGVGLFGGFFQSPGADKMLVASADGVGTKLKVAVMANRHDTVGQDIVNHCVNDILVHNARPLFFMDYIGASKLDIGVMHQILSGICKACKENGCALLGGETAELPGLYPQGEYDLVGTIVGEVAHKDIIKGDGMRTGDMIIGLASSGIHTNGYSLARKVIFESAGLSPCDTFPGTKKTVADVLLAVHKSYLKPVSALVKAVPVQAMAHITGGGFVDNVDRVMRKGLSAVFDASAWRVPQVFRFIKEEGKVEDEEMYRVFNMGIGMTVFVRPAHVAKALRSLERSGAEPVLIGRVERGKVPVRFDPPL